MDIKYEKEPQIRVGIVAERCVEVLLSGRYYIEESPGVVVEGKTEVCCTGSAIAVKMENGKDLSSEKFRFTPVDDNCCFTIKDVTIGVDFHWERREDQKFTGGVEYVVEQGKVRVINLVSIEKYLTSVISSEMSATSSRELLKAHAVISRSWLLAQIEKQKFIASENKEYRSTVKSEKEIIRWYDREDHSNFDVCADDHCQRYQGITRVISGNAAKAIRETSGEVLVSAGAVCDTRFSKCCGGVSESYENCWEPVRYSYLKSIVDSESTPEGYDLDLTEEKNAEKWIRSVPPAFCQTDDKNILSQVLNNYDQETSDFYRWKVEYSRSELSGLVKKRTGMDFGEINALIPVQRGDSGRIIKLRIEGTRKTMTIGKELEIRRTLSETHLYSSAFVVDTLFDENDIPERFILTGAGWGHGVGLCQIGAAVMGAKGYTYQEILEHYFKSAELKRVY